MNTLYNVLCWGILLFVAIIILSGCSCGGYDFFSRTFCEDKVLEDTSGIIDNPRRPS